MRFFGSLIASGLVVAGLLQLSRPASANEIKVMAGKLCTSNVLKARDLFDRAISEQGAAAVNRALSDHREKYGACRRVLHVKGPHVEYIHERAVIPGKLYLGPTKKISGIWFGSAKLTHDSIDAIAKELKQLPGVVAFAARQMDTKAHLSINASRPLAVGSAFKLAILQALKERVDRGKLRWNDIITLRAEWASLPSGLLQDWPVGAPLTLQSLATLMISKSDNTATDHLLFHLGRKLVERYALPRNKPLLSTAEMFKLKSTQAAKLARRFAKSGETQRRRLLRRLRAIPLDGLQIKGSPAFVEKIEWFFSTDELCRMIYALRDLDLLGVNPGLADKKRWRTTRYKGGSEPGVLNATHLLQHKKTGAWICVSGTWNDPVHNVTFKTFADLLTRAIHLMERSP